MLYASVSFAHAHTQGTVDGKMEQGMAKKLLEAQVDDGEEGQTNGVLQHYAYRYIDTHEKHYTLPTQKTAQSYACLYTFTEPLPLRSAS